MTRIPKIVLSAKLSRDTVLFGTGIVGIVHETVVKNVDRPTLLILFGAMVGLPVFLRGDESRKLGGKEAGETDDDG